MPDPFLRPSARASFNAGFQSRAARLAAARARGRRLLPRARGRLWLGPLVILLLACLALKAEMIAQLGLGPYEAVLAELARGSLAEQIGARLLRPDPVALWLAGGMRP